MDNDIVEQELAVTTESRELAIFKSAYYQLNAKPDSISRAYSRKVIITREDIIDFCLLYTSPSPRDA